MAAAVFQAAARVAHEQGARAWSLKIAISLARLRRKAADKVEARAALETLVQEFEG